VRKRMAIAGNDRSERFITELSKRMAVRWRVALVIAAGVLLVIGWTGQAAYAAGSTIAATRFSAQTTAKGLSLSIAGSTVILGASSSRGASVMSGSTVYSTEAQASGSGELLPILTGNASASSTHVRTSDSQPQQCATPSIPGIGPLGSPLAIALACGSADTNIGTTGAVDARSTGSVASVGVNLAGLLSKILVGPSSPVSSALNTILGQLPKLPAAGLPLSQLLGEVLHMVSTLQTLSIQVGQAKNSSIVEQNSSTGDISASASSTGAQIQVLPGAGGSGIPLIGVSLGSSDATVGFNPSTGALSASDSPGVVSLSVFTPVTGQKSFKLAPGQSQTILGGTPLQSTITVGDGSHSVSGDNANATVTALSIDLFEGAGALASSPYSGGIRLGFASSTASLVGDTTQISTPPTTTQPPAIPGPTNIHTGEPWAGWAPLVVALPVVLGILLLAWPRLAGSMQQYVYRKEVAGKRHSKFERVNR
jgi:hypothetical protein